MVRKHNVLTAISLVLAIGAGTAIGVTEWRHQKMKTEYNALVRREAVRFKACPDLLKLKDPPGSCANRDERVLKRDEAERLAKKGGYLNAGLLYIDLGDWVSARNMAGRAGEGDREKIKYELKLRQDAIEEAKREADRLAK